MRARRCAVGVALAAAAALTGCAAPSGSAGQDGAAARVVVPDDGSPYAGTVLDRPYRMPALTFTDTAGEPFRLAEDTDAPVTIVFFGYTSCPDVCGIVLSGAASALRRSDEQVRERTQLVFITTDPARDTPRVIRDYLDRFDPAFVGLTADLATVKAAAEQLGVGLSGRQKLPDGGYEVGHSAQLIGFGPDHKGRLVWTPGTAVGDLRADIARLSRQA